MTKVLITGAGGQLASCFAKIASEFPKLDLVFLSLDELDITNQKQISSVFNDESPFDYCINCAAYTQVDQAENDEEKAYLVNAAAPGILARECKARDSILIHISTDFVFSGSKLQPYTELDEAEPIGVYGRTKLQGERHIQEVLDRFFIIRTSWLYSEFGNNFVKTMLRLAHERTKLSVVNDQIGSPTYAVDLARAIFTIIDSESKNFGVYHFSNKGELSWYDFAAKIFELKNIKIELLPIATKEYPTLATRPPYSVLDTSKIEKNLEIDLKNWEESLKVALINLDD